MNRNLKIADIISKLNETEDLLKDNFFSEIDKDLILEKIRKIYEKILTGNSEKPHDEALTNVVDEASAVTSVNNEIISEPVEIEAVSDIIIPESNENKKITEPVLFEPEVYVKEHVTEDKKNPEINPTLFDVETFVTDKAVHSKKETGKKEISDKPEANIISKTISDQYQSNPVKTVSDLISKSKTATGGEKDLTSRIHLKPVKNIKSAISINDRIMFTKELFDDDPDFYNEIVEKVNNMNNLTEAMDYLSIEINVEEDSEAVKKFVELIHRRYT